MQIGLFLTGSPLHRTLLCWADVTLNRTSGFHWALHRDSQIFAWKADISTAVYGAVHCSWLHWVLFNRAYFDETSWLAHVVFVPTVSIFVSVCPLCQSLSHTVLAPARGLGCWPCFGWCGGWLKSYLPLPCRVSVLFVVLRVYNCQCHCRLTDFVLALVDVVGLCLIWFNVWNFDRFFFLIEALKSMEPFTLRSVSPLDLPKSVAIVLFFTKKMFYHTN